MFCIAEYALEQGVDLFFQHGFFHFTGLSEYQFPALTKDSRKRQAAETVTKQLRHFYRVHVTEQCWVVDAEFIGKILHRLLVIDGNADKLDVIAIF